MLDDLIRLKSEIEGRQEYVILYNEWPDVKIKLDDAKPLSEYAAQEDTDGFIKQCESLIENMVVFLSERGIPYDSISLSCPLGTLCKAKFAQKLQDMKDAHSKVVYDMTGEEFENAQDAFEAQCKELLKSELKQNISPFLVPLNFCLDIYIDLSHKHPLIDRKAEQELRKLSRLQLSGIVNLNQFVSKMKSLGYDIGTEVVTDVRTDFAECSTIENYIKAFINPYSEITIIADFTKKINSPNENKQMK